jgi:hypothetical protein
MKHAKFVTIGNTYLKSLFPELEICDEKLKEKRKKIIDLLDEKKEHFDHLDRLITDFEQFKVRQNPTVYITRRKSPENKDLVYFQGRCFYPYPNGERKDVVIYIGRVERYDNNTKNPRLRSDAVKKMKETLERRHNEGTI